MILPATKPGLTREQRVGATSCAVLLACMVVVNVVISATLDTSMVQDVGSYLSSTGAALSCRGSIGLLYQHRDRAMRWITAGLVVCIVGAILTTLGAIVEFL